MVDWTAIGLAALTTIVGIMSALFWRVVNSLATKEDLIKAKAEIMEADAQADQAALDAIERRVEKRHNENLDMLREMRDDIRSFARHQRGERT